MIVRLWHTSPLQNSVRGTFELPEWPYAISNYGPIPQKTTEYLQGLTVIRLELEKKLTKLLVPVPESSPLRDRGEWANMWKGPFECYTSFCIVNPKTLKIEQWNPLHPNFSRFVRGDAVVSSGMDGVRVEKNPKAPPDSFTWLEFNKRIIVKHMNSSILYLG